MPPEKYKVIYENDFAKIEKGNYGNTRIYIYKRYFYCIKLLNEEPEYLENLIYNFIELCPRLVDMNLDNSYENGYNDAKKEIRESLKELLGINI